MFKLHQDIEDWYYWYSPRQRKWCARHKREYIEDNLKFNEQWSVKALSKGALKRMIQDWKDGLIE